MRIVTLIALVSIIAYSCKSEEPAEPEEPLIDIFLYKNDNSVIFEKYVIIYNEDDYLIKTPLSDFIGSLYMFYTYDYEKYLEGVDKILMDAELTDSLNVSDYFEGRRFKSILANFLEDGLCYIEAKDSGATIEQIQMKKWFNDIPGAGSAGRDFYINEKLFLAIVDLIS